MSEKLAGESFCFLHDEAGNISTVFSNSRLFLDEEYRNLALHPYPVNKEILKQCSFSEGVLNWADRIPVETLDTKPITVVETSDRGFVISHGNHRYIKAFLLRRTHIQAKYVPEKLWRKYVFIIDIAFKVSDPKTMVA